MQLKTAILTTKAFEVLKKLDVFHEIVYWLLRIIIQNKSIWMTRFCIYELKESAIGNPVFFVSVWINELKKWTRLPVFASYKAIFYVRSKALFSFFTFASKYFYRICHFSDLDQRKDWSYYNYKYSVVVKLERNCILQMRIIFLWFNFLANKFLFRS